MTPFSVNACAVFTPHSRALKGDIRAIRTSFMSHTSVLSLIIHIGPLSFVTCHEKKKKNCRSCDECTLPERRFPIAEQYSWQQCGWCWMLSRKHARWLVQNGAGALRWMVCPYPRCWCRLRTSLLGWTHAVAKFKVHQHTVEYVCAWYEVMASTVSA